MKKINLEVTCKLNRFGYWNSCKRLPNFLNVAALYIGHMICWALDNILCDLDPKVKVI